MSDTDAHKIVEAANLLRSALHKLVVSEQGIHAETIVAAAARMAGTALHRAMPGGLHGAAEGAVVLSDQANQEGQELTRLLFSTLRQLGHSKLDEQRLGGAAESTTLARLSLAETQEMLGPWCRKIRDVCDLTWREFADAAVIATADVIHECRTVLAVRSGCAIAIYGMVESLKTVPPKDAEVS